MANPEQPKEQSQEKSDKTSFIGKIWKRGPKAPEAGAPGGDIYKKKSLGAQLLSQLLQIFVVLALVFAGYLALKIYGRMEDSRTQQELRERYSKNFDDMQDKARESASVVSLGKILVNSYKAGNKGIMSIDLWVRCNDPDAAAFAQEHNLVMRDKAIEALAELSQKNIDFLSEGGKARAREAIRRSMNTAFRHGRVEEVFFHRLVIQ